MYLKRRKFSSKYFKVPSQNLGNRVEKIQETFNKELEELKSEQPMMIIEAMKEN